MKLLKYKYRLYPTPEQETQMIIAAGHNRFVWNYFLAQEIKQYATDKKFRWYNTNSADLTKLKQTEEWSWLNDAPAVSLQQTLRNLERALKTKCQRKNSNQGFPKFKKRKNFCRSYTLTMVNAERNVTPNGFYIPKVGVVKCVYHRAIGGEFSSCQIKQEAGRWYVVLTCKVENIEHKPTTGLAIGIDLNSNECVGSDGRRWAIPKYLKENQFQIKHLQRALARKQKGSKNSIKAQGKLAKLHDRVKRKRLDYFHKLSTALVTGYDCISLEDLDVAGIQRKNGHITKDNGFYMFRHMIEYKADLYGKTAVVVDRYFPSSQLCSCCGHRQKMPLNIRVYDCPKCHMSLDRDLNAAININRAGTARSAFGEIQSVEQEILLGILSGFIEEGSHVL